MTPSTPLSLALRGNLTSFLAFAGRFILVLTLSRVLLVVWQWQRVSDADMISAVFLQGLRFDLVLLGIVLLIPVLLFPLLASNRQLLPVWRGFLIFYFSAALLIVTFMEFSTPSFIDQFDSRPNILFVEYLKYPREVAATLWAAYKLPLLFAMTFVAIFTMVNVKQFRRIVRPTQATGLLPALAITPLLLIMCVAMIRSTTDHRPVNPSTVALSTDPLANDLALNSTYTVLYAIRETRHEAKGGFRYANIPADEIVSVVRASMHIPSVDFVSDQLPTLHEQRLSASRTGRKNLVIVVEESLGAEFVGSLGGLDLTPNIDRLSAEGIWFSNLYATGTRSVRGLEALVSGFTPSPARSVIKLGKSQRDFFTIAELLRNLDYDTSFIYGGEAQFDNMRRFFMNNGFSEVIDEKDYENPVFVGSWGVSDEDLFDRAHQEFSAKGEQPFFGLVFTSSNHSPFQFPDGRIELYDDEKATVNNAVKYADHALGQFIENAKNSNYWDSTVFLIVADHNSRVYGSEVVPIERFHIPALILGGSISPSRFARVASQIDLPPTLLALMGIADLHPMIGHDLTRSDESKFPGRAIMQFNGTQAYMESDQVIVLRKDLPVQQYQYLSHQLVPQDQSDPLLVSKALATSAWTSMAYEQSLYRLPHHAMAEAANESPVLLNYQTFQRILKKPEALVFLFSLWVALTCNIGYWTIVASSNATGNLPGVAFLANLALLTLGLISLVMLLLAVGIFTRIVLMLALVVSAAAGYFTHRFGTLIDTNMLINVFQTDPAEASDLLTLPFVATVVLLGVLPAIAVWKYPFARRRLHVAIRDRGVALLLAVCLIAGPLYVAQKEVMSFGRNHREVRHAIAPINAISAGFVLVRDALETPPVYRQIGLDAAHADAGSDGDLPRVHVLLIGETARAQNFSLDGYPRNTNPELQAIANVLYTRASSCGTATATSLPCMLTEGGRNGFDRVARQQQDNLLDIAARSGYAVYWVDNGNGCKTLCDRVDSRDLHLADVDSLCSETACFDEILVHELKSLLANVSGDTLIVMHPLGSHGPAYFRRYPEEYRRFVPDCRSQNFGDCSKEEIVNSYDNTIVYTDHVIAAAIDALAAESDRINPSLLYMSDHGESLGEHNLFLHGMPYNLAPETQKQVPMISWFGGQAARGIGPHSICQPANTQNGISHDNLFHTELGLLDIQTSAYRKDMDIFAGCLNAEQLAAAEPLRANAT